MRSLFSRFKRLFIRSQPRGRTRQIRQCRAIKGDGKQCQNRAKFGTLCGVHLPKRAENAAGKKLKQFGEIVVLAGGAAKLVEELVKLWQSLPFGPGPKMPAEYHALTKQIGIVWPITLRRLAVGNFGAQSVNWEGALGVYTSANRLVGELQSGTLDENAAKEELESLESQTLDLLDGLQLQVQTNLYYHIGQMAGDESAENAP